MSRLLAAWLLLILVCVLASTVSAAVPRTWPFWPRLLVSWLIMAIPAGFTGYALQVLGVELLGGAS